MALHKPKQSQTKKKIKKTLTDKLLALGLIFIMIIISLPKIALAQLFDGAEEKVSGIANATIKLPNTEYNESTIDLRVKVLGGEVKLNRTWVNGRWYINPAWATLRLITGPNGYITAIDRAGTIYQLDNKAVYSRTGDQQDTSVQSTYSQEILYSFEQIHIKRTKTGWRWYDQQGNWINYDKAGRILAYGNRNNIEVSFVLDDDNRRVAVKDHNGELVYNFSYDDQDHLIKVTDREGRSVSYEWSGDRLIQVTDVLGNKWLYGYDANGQLNRKTEPDGGVMKIDYSLSVPAPKTAMDSGKDGGGRDPQMQPRVYSTASSDRDTQLARVGKITDKTGAVTIYNTQYNRTNKQYTISIDDPLGKKTVSQFDAKGRVLSRKVNDSLTATYQRDDKNYILKYIDQRGLTTTTQYNQNHYPIKVTFPNGAVETYEYDNNLNQVTRFTNAQGNTIHWQYDNAGNLLKQIESEGKPEQRITSWSYDSHSQPTKVVVGEGTLAITLQQSFDKYGNISTYTDGNGNNYQYNYNIQGQITTVTNPLKNSWKTAYNLAGYPTQAIDPLNHITHYTTDAMGRVTVITDPLGNKTTYSYQFNNGWQVTQTNALGEATSYLYDSLGRFVKATSASGQVIEQSYNKDGKMETLTDPANNKLTFKYGTKGSQLDGLLVESLYPTYSESYQYNNLGLTTSVAQQLASNDELTTSISYNALGLPVAVTDPANRTSQVEYNSLGNQIKSLDALGQTTQQTWDRLNNLASVTDAKGNNYSFEYDNNGNLIKETRALGNLVSYSYDVDNQLVAQKDASGNVTSYQYDAVGNLVKETFTQANQTTPNQTVIYQYNDANQLIEVSQTGETNSHFTYLKDKLGRTIKETISYGEGTNKITKTLQYAYNADGNLATITYPDNSQINYHYEKGQLKEIVLANGEKITWANYNWQVPTQINYPNATQTISYDALQRPLSIKVTDANNKLLMNRNYNYDKVSNLTQQQSEEGTTDYQYDLLDRLTAVTPSKTLQQKGLPIEAYSYDAIDNRIGSAHQAGDWLYNDKNQLIQWGESTNEAQLTYTANGQLAKETAKGKELTYTYNSADRLVNVKDGDKQIAAYQYDPFGRRISKTVNDATTYFIYTEEGLITELDEKGTIQVAYGWQPDTPWGTSPLWQANLTANQTLQTASYNYLITDYLGTPQLAINSQGQQTWKVLSDAFGNSVVDTNNQITINLRFPGQYYDQETGLHYNYFRDYNPKTGRYIQSDPIGISGGINTFGYAAANPLYWTDSYGLALDTVSNWCRRNPLACMELGFGLLPRPLPEQFPKPISPENCPEEQMSPFPQLAFPPIFPSIDNGGNDLGNSNTTTDFPTWDTGYRPSKAEEGELSEEGNAKDPYWKNGDKDHCPDLGRDIDGLAKATEARAEDMRGRLNPDKDHYNTYIDRYNALKNMVEAAQKMDCPYNPLADKVLENKYKFPRRR